MKLCIHVFFEKLISGLAKTCTPKKPESKKKTFEMSVRSVCLISFFFSKDLLLFLTQKIFFSTKKKIFESKTTVNSVRKKTLYQAKIPYIK